MPDINENELRQLSFFDKIFVSKTAFLTSNLVAIICFFYDAYIVFRYSDLPSVFSLASVGVLIVSLICMRYCSRAYKDNAVKSIIGFVLGIIFIYDLRFFDNNYFDFSPTNIVFGAVKIVMGLALVVLYIFARDSKRSNYKLIMYVRIAFFTVAVLAVLNNMPYYISDWNGGILHWFLQDIAETLAFICTYFSIVCAASAVDRYKLIRDYYTELGKWAQDLRGETKKNLFGK